MTKKTIPTLSQPEIDLLLEFIARDHLCIEILETRHRDGLDFHEVSVANVKAALLAAFDAGRRADRRRTRVRSKDFGPTTPAANAIYAPSIVM